MQISLVSASTIGFNRVQGAEGGGGGARGGGGTQPVHHAPGPLPSVRRDSAVTTHQPALLAVRLILVSSSTLHPAIHTETFSCTGCLIQAFASVATAYRHDHVTAGHCQLCTVRAAYLRGCTGGGGGGCYTFAHNKSGLLTRITAKAVTNQTPPAVEAAAKPQQINMRRRFDRFGSPRTCWTRQGRAGVYDSCI
jgi:hypothetical protein